ncbi:MAG: cytochrome biosis protein [Paenibacillaceae bacterium]|jgi:peroxiredoxin|nr:cytochrome biosis protein [Paenibacillaceae bacterium]
MRNIVVVIILLFLVVWGVLDYQEKGQTAGISKEDQAMVAQNKGKVGVQVGNTAADFALKKPDGQTVKLSDYAGKKVIVNFWASWCPPCREETPALVKFYKDYENQNVVLLGVNLTNTEKEPDDGILFAKQNNVTYPILLDSDGKAADLYALVGYPTTVVIDSHGEIRYKFIGGVSYDSLKRTIAQID